MSTGVVVLDPSDLDTIIKKMVEEFRAEVAKIKAANIEKPMTREQAAKFFSCSVDALDKKFRNNKLPAKFRHYNGGTPYFFASELENFLKKS